MLQGHSYTRFPAKGLVGGGSLTVGCVVILSGLSAMEAGQDMFSWLVPVIGVGLGVLFLHAAWKVLRE